MRSMRALVLVALCLFALVAIASANDPPGEQTAATTADGEANNGEQRQNAQAVSDPAEQTAVENNDEKVQGDDEGEQEATDVTVRSADDDDDNAVATTENNPGDGGEDDLGELPGLDEDAKKAESELAEMLVARDRLQKPVRTMLSRGIGSLSGDDSDGGANSVADPAKVAALKNKMMSERAKRAFHNADPISVDEEEEGEEVDVTEEEFKRIVDSAPDFASACVPAAPGSTECFGTELDFIERVAAVKRGLFRSSHMHDPLMDPSRGIAEKENGVKPDPSDIAGDSPKHEKPIPPGSHPVRGTQQINMIHKPDFFDKSREHRDASATFDALVEEGSIPDGQVLRKEEQDARGEGRRDMGFLKDDKKKEKKTTKKKPFFGMRKPLFLVGGVMGTSMEAERKSGEPTYTCPNTGKPWRKNEPGKVAAWVPLQLDLVDASWKDGITFNSPFDCCQLGGPLMMGVDSRGEATQRRGWNVRARRGGEETAEAVHRLKGMMQLPADGALAKLGKADLEGLVSLESIRHMVDAKLLGMDTGKFVNPYFDKLIKLLSKHDYVDGLDLHAVPYDWRLNCNRVSDQLPQFEALVWRLAASVRTTGLKAVLVGHSYGVIFTLSFLKAVEDGAPEVVAMLRTYFAEQREAYGNFETRESREQWLEAHIDRLILVGGPLIGSPATLGHVSAGSSLLRDQCRSELWRQAHAIPASAALSASKRHASEWASVPHFPGPAVDHAAYEEVGGKSWKRWAWEKITFGAAKKKRERIAREKFAALPKGVSFEVRARTPDEKYGEARVSMHELGKSLFTKDVYRDRFAVSGAQFAMMTKNLEEIPRVGENPPRVVTSYKIPAVFVYAGMGASTPLAFSAEVITPHADKAPLVGRRMFTAEVLPTVLTDGDGTVPSLSLTWFDRWAGVKSVAFDPDAGVVRGAENLYRFDLADDEASSCAKYKRDVYGKKMKKGCKHINNMSNSRVMRIVLSAGIVR